MECGYCEDTKQIANGEGCSDCIQTAKEQGYYLGPIECPFCKEDEKKEKE